MSDDTNKSLTTTKLQTSLPRVHVRAALGGCLKGVNFFAHRMSCPQGEVVEPHVEQTIADSVKLTRDHQHARWDQDPPFRRGFHAKSNGVVKATFKINDDIDEDLRVGVFAQPGHEYQAWIRFSNGNQFPQNDEAMDTRGMAIKLMGVPGAKLGLPHTDGFEAEAQTQDFIMMAGYSCFFVASAAEYVKFQEAPSSGSYYLNQAKPDRAHRMREFLIAFQNSGIAPATPTDCRYFSLAPYKLGEGAMKYSVWQTGGPKPPPFDKADPNFLRKGLAQQLSEGALTMTFAIQKRVEGSNMPLEDWTIEWRESDSPYRAAATITIEPQDIDAEERRVFGDSLSYNPWHSLPEHRPLGQIGKLRGVVYQNSRQLRHFENEERWGEPTDFESGLPKPPPTSPEIGDADG